MLGLIDQVFDGISTWADIDKLQPGEKGLLLKIKGASQQDPVCSTTFTHFLGMDAVQLTLPLQVFRSINYHAAPGEDLINKEQMMSQDVIDKLSKLSWLCGLKYAMLPNVLRRGSAYLLANTVTAEERKARMGHKESSTVYLSSYRNEMSTVDFQALRLKIEQEDVAVMSSAFLNTSVEDSPPSRVSDQGMTEVLTDPELAAIMTEMSTLLDELLTEYGSLSAAQAQAPARRQQYTVLQKRYHVRFVSLQRQQYTIEYKAWWASKKEGRQIQQAEPQEVVGGGGGGGGGGGSSSTSEIDQPAGEPQDCDSITPIDPQLLKDEYELGDDSIIPINPQLLEQMAEASAAADALVMDMKNAGEEEDEADLSDAVQADECY